MKAKFFILPAMLISSTFSDRNKACFRCTKIHSQFGIFSYPSFKKASSNCLLHNKPRLMDDRTSFLQEVRRALQLSQWIWPFVSWKTYPNICTFWFWNFEQSGSSLPNFTWVYADTASAACPSQPGNLALTSIIFCSSHLGRRRALFSEDCVGCRIVLYNVHLEHDSVLL